MCVGMSNGRISELEAEVTQLRQLVAYADAMLVERRRERQETFDAEHPECGGVVQAAEPLDSAVRTYQFYRVRWSDALGLPRAMTALRPPITRTSSEEG